MRPPPLHISGWSRCRSLSTSILQMAALDAPNRPMPSSLHSRISSPRELRVRSVATIVEFAGFCIATDPKDILQINIQDMKAPRVPDSVPSQQVDNLMYRSKQICRLTVSISDSCLSRGSISHKLRNLNIFLPLPCSLGNQQPGRG